MLLATPACPLFDCSKSFVFSAVVQRTYEPYFDLCYSHNKYLQWGLLRLMFSNFKFQHAIEILSRLTDTSLRKAMSRASILRHAGVPTLRGAPTTGYQDACQDGFGSGLSPGKTRSRSRPLSHPCRGLPAITMTRWLPFFATVSWNRRGVGN